MCLFHHLFWGRPWFAVCVDMEYICQESKTWYYEDDMWWHVRNFQKEVEHREKDFEKIIHELNKSTDDMTDVMVK
jgi:hypothetical protein